MSWAGNPFRLVGAWDQIVVAGVASPGLCDISNAARAYAWDKKKANGKKGATHTFRGDDPKPFRVKFRLFTEQQVDDWADFAELLHYDSTKTKVEAVDIVHPALDDLGIYSVVVEDIGQLTHEGGMLFSVTVTFSENLPPSKGDATSTPTTSATNKTNTSATGAGAPAPTAKSAQEKEIERLLELAKQP